MRRKRLGRAALIAPADDPQMIAEMRPHPFGPRRIGGRFPFRRTAYLGGGEMIEREGTLRRRAGSAVSARAQCSGNSGKRRNVFGIVPIIELALVLGSDAHRVQQQRGCVLWSITAALCDLLAF